MIKAESRRKIILYGLVYFLLLITMVVIMCWMFDFNKILGDHAVERPQGSFSHAMEIIANNTKNFLGYVILFPVYPLLIFMDCLFTAWSVAVSIHAQGLKDTLILLLPHGMIEMPNFIIYTNLSYINFKIFCTRKVSLNVFWENFKSNKYYYMVCVFLLIISGLIEGLSTQSVYNAFNK